MVSKGQFLGQDWNRIGTALRGYTAKQRLAHMKSLTASHCHTKAYQDTASQPPR